MVALLYDELCSWYRLLDPAEDHAEEAGIFRRAFVEAVDGPADSLLELGSGAGHNALHLRERFDCTLSDPSESMLGLSRELNPSCEHLVGDMRTLRLGREFDVILVHDAVVYMTSESDLRAVIETAFLHTRPGGAAIFAPDHTTETFEENTQVYEGQAGEPAMRCLEWTWDPDPHDTTYITEYAFLLRDGLELRAVHDRHVEGLFSRVTWLRLRGEAGFEVDSLARPVDGEECDEVFLCRRRSA